MVPGITPSRQKMSNQGENLRGRQALIMIDGVPQVNPLRNGNRYGYTIDPSMVERIEVVNGASAVQGMEQQAVSSTTSRKVQNRVMIGNKRLVLV